MYEKEEKKTRRVAHTFQPTHVHNIIILLDARRTHQSSLFAGLPHGTLCGLALGAGLPERKGLVGGRWPAICDRLST